VVAGVLLYEIATMKLLLCDPTDIGNLTKIFTITLTSRNKGLPLPPAFVSERPLLVALIKQLMAFDAGARLGMRAAMAHAFMAGVDLQKLRTKQLPVP
jgi:hypothetical protein